MQSPRPLTSYKIIVFDVYGTLVDWDSGIYNSLLPVLPPSWSREDALVAYSAVEKDLQARNPKLLYRDLLAKAHEVLCARLDQKSEEPAQMEGRVREGQVPVHTNQHTEFADSLKSWPVFPDTIQGLRSLSKHFKLVVLSNVDHQSFASTHEQLCRNPAEECESPFTLILTAQDTGAYKPSLTCLQHALSLFASSPHFDGATKDDVLVVAQSLYHDHMPANKLGLDSAWIDRAGAVMGVEKDVKDKAKWGWRFATLGEMAEHVEREPQEKQTK
jgi:2-haloalkanoic acid dehalogenase type II